MVLKVGWDDKVRRDIRKIDYLTFYLWWVRYQTVRLEFIEEWGARKHGLILRNDSLSKARSLRESRKDLRRLVTKNNNILNSILVLSLLNEIFCF